METLPILIPISFIATTLLAIWLFYRSSRNSKLVLIVLAVWLIIQLFIARAGFYLITDSMPPRFGLLVGPPLVAIILLFATRKGREFLDRLDTSWLTILHIVRVPVELILFGLFAYHLVPRAMTFEGDNLDILSGLSAPIVFFFGYKRKTMSRTLIIAWNVLCLGLLFNIVGHAILSLPTPFQRIAFEQPNRALLYFPFVWLPCCVVPLVLLSHLATLRKSVRWELTW